MTDRTDRMAELIRLIAEGKASGYDIAELHLLQRLRVREMRPKSLYPQDRGETNG